MPIETGLDILKELGSFNNNAGYARILKAYTLAANAHQGQFRKDGLTPYINHPARVAVLINRFRGTEPQIITGLWHDVPEDCGMQYIDAMIACLTELGYSNFTGARIIRMVLSLTKNPEIKGRQEKNEDALNRCQLEGTEFVKLCDRLDNIRDIGGMDPKFVPRYLEETDHLLQVFGISGIPFDNERNVHGVLKLEVERVRRDRGLV